MKTKISIDKIYPILTSQRGILVESLGNNDNRYCQQICVEVLKDINTEQIQKNITRAVHQHEILRTIFDWQDGNPLQVVTNGIKPEINIIHGADEDSLPRILAEEKISLRPIDISPPIRFTILANKTLSLIITYNHILLDGLSIQLLIDQIIREDKNVDDTTSKGYVDWLNRNVNEDCFDLWKNFLKDIGPNSGVIEGTITRQEVSQTRVQLGEDFKRNLVKVSQRTNCTQAIIMQTLFSEWARYYFNKSLFLYGLVLNTRIPKLTEKSLGNYITTIPWVSYNNNSRTFYEEAKATNDDILNLYYAKHISLGEIVKNCSIFASNFDAILTITTSAIGKSENYKILETFENTGYKISVDIEIRDDVEIIFSTLTQGLDNAINSFSSYCIEQISSYKKIRPEEHITHATTKKIRGGPNPNNSTDLLLRNLISEVLNYQSTIDANDSFLNLGGDSITALRLRLLLKERGYEVSIGDILQSCSIKELATRVGTLNQRTTHKDIQLAFSNYGKSVENVSFIPKAAKHIVNYYRDGYGQDYHEQSAFRLKGILDTKLFKWAIQKLGNEIPTLRLLYPNSMTELQILNKDPRIQFSIKKPGYTTFNKFIKKTSAEDWAKPFDIEVGPIFRVVTNQANDQEWYLFLAFSALVTDGWSFANLLERLFEIYSELLIGKDCSKNTDNYFKYSQDSTHYQCIIESPRNINKFDSEVIGRDYFLDKQIAQKLHLISKNKKLTLSQLFLEIAEVVLKNRNTGRMLFHENGRDEPSVFSSVGPFSYNRIINIGKNNKCAYYVFENYPRESENHLKSGKVSNFREFGNWRRDLLPPGCMYGIYIDSYGDQIKFRVETRTQFKEEISAIWGSFNDVLYNKYT